MLNLCGICWENLFFRFIYPGRVCWVHTVFHSKHLPGYLFTSIVTHTYYLKALTSWTEGQQPSYWGSNSPPFADKFSFLLFKRCNCCYSTDFPNSYFSNLGLPLSYCHLECHTVWKEYSLWSQTYRQLETRVMLWHFFRPLGELSAVLPHWLTWSEQLYFFWWSICQWVTGGKRIFR